MIRPLDSDHRICSSIFDSRIFFFFFFAFIILSNLNPPLLQKSVKFACSNEIVSQTCMSDRCCCSGNRMSFSHLEKAYETRLWNIQEHGTLTNGQEYCETANAVTPQRIIVTFTFVHASNTKDINSVLKKNTRGKNKAKEEY